MSRHEELVMREDPAARILIVDDDPASVQIMARALKSVCRCEFALSGRRRWSAWPRIVAGADPA
jgi:CheY-like chemotaxis protein